MSGARADVGTLRERLAALVLDAGSVEVVVTVLSSLCGERAQAIKERWAGEVGRDMAGPWSAAAGKLYHAAKGVTV